MYILTILLSWVIFVSKSTFNTERALRETVWYRSVYFDVLHIRLQLSQRFPNPGMNQNIGFWISLNMDLIIGLWASDRWYIGFDD